MATAGVTAEAPLQAQKRQHNYYLQMHHIQHSSPLASNCKWQLMINSNFSVLGNCCTLYIQCMEDDNDCKD